MEVPAGGGAPFVVCSAGDESGIALDSVGDLFVTGAGDNNFQMLEVQRSQPPTLSFPGTTTVGYTSSGGPLTAQVYNDGNEALAITGLSYPADFLLASGDANTCTNSTSLSAGQECDVPVQFTPVNVGAPLSENVTLTDNTLNVSGAQQSIAVTGTAVSDAATRFAVRAASSAVAGSPFIVTVNALSATGSPSTVYNGTVRFSSSDPLFFNAGTLTLSGGVGQKTVTLYTAGTQTITVTDTTTSTLTGSASVGVTSGPVASLTLTGVPASTYAGAQFGFTVFPWDLYGNPATATVSFSSSDPSATLPTATLLSGRGRTVSAALVTPGSQTITATDTANSSIAVTSNPISVTNANFVVTTAADDAGLASNCTLQAAPGTDAACSLRDAVLAANKLGAGNISFDATKFVTAQTITLGSAGTIVIPSYASICGPTTGAGATLTNLVTVSGATACEIFSVSNTSNNGYSVTLNGLNLTGCASSSGGDQYSVVVNSATLTVRGCSISGGHAVAYYPGGIKNLGSLTVTDSAFSDNSTNDFSGGAILNNGLLTVANSTFSGNSAIGGAAGAVYNNGVMTVTNSTFQGNFITGGGAGGAIYNDGTLTVANSSFSANSVASGEAGGIFNQSTMKLANSIV